MKHPLVLAITGASGAAYAVRLIECLSQARHPTHLSISPTASTVIEQELQRNIDLDQFELNQLISSADVDESLFTYHHHRDFMAPIASGSHLTSGMVICPCSGTTLSSIVTAAGNNLIQRAADVHLKERRKLVVVPRETPLSLVHLKNMQAAAEAGAIVLPAMPGFYHGAETFQDLVDFVVARILDQFQIEHTLMKRWGE